MENATDALYMAFAVLAFVLALSISIGAFSQVTAVSQYIVDTRDRETEYTYVKYQDEHGNVKHDRTVSAETIVPALYKAYEENYIIRFYFTDRDDDIFEITKNGEPPVRTNEVNLRKLIGIGNAKDADEFISALLEGNVNSIDKFSTSIKLLPSGKFYDIIKARKFMETLGIYYEDDLKDLSDSSIDDVNKTEVRVITYSQQ